MDERVFCDGLNPAQAEAVTTESNPLCILAGAGSGKTRVLTRRIAHRVATGSADPRHVVAVTFTRKAAGELSSRLAAIGIRERVVTGTFHSIAYAQLRRRWADRREAQPTVLARKTRILVPLLPARLNATVQAVDLAAEIEWAKARMIPPDRYEAAVAAVGRRPPLAPAPMADLYRRYEAEKARRGLVDFDDLLMLCATALESDNEFAAAQRWRFRHLFVDEFQDVNPAQFRLVRAWDGGRGDLCVVGDPNQAIYGWNGAEASYLTRFRQWFPGASLLRLDDNYRSSPQILSVAGAVLDQSASGAKGAVGLKPNRPEGPIPTVRSFETDVAEAQAIAHSVREARGVGGGWGAIAVLTRTNAQSVLFEEAFRKASIPCRVRGGGAFLDQPEVRQAIADLRSTKARVPFASLLDDLEAAATSDQSSGTATTAERASEIEALVRLGREYAAVDPEAGVEGFLGWLAATVRTDEPDSGGDAVDLVTFHRAKGLEWPVVFVAGMERGLVPIGHADSPADVAEERRLLYVAITRAQRELHFSWAEKRTFGSRTITRTPSPWLERVEAACCALARDEPTDWRLLLAAGRARLEESRRRRTPGGARRPQVGERANPRVLTALKEWRSNTARAIGVPAFVIFHDSTLAAVAEALPRNREALLSLPGVGPVKADRYGDALLEVVSRIPTGTG